MKATKQIIILILATIICSCELKTAREDIEHKYITYWNTYTEQQLIDTLYSDTLRVGTDIEFYRNATKELLVDLQDDKNKIDSLYPMKAFNKLTIRKLPFGIEKTFTKEQAEKFLEIINNPVSFNWSETTYEAKYCIDFWKNKKLVATLTIDDDTTIIKNKQGESIRKMKFGRLNNEKILELKNLLNTIER